MGLKLNKISTRFSNQHSLVTFIAHIGKTRLDIPYSAFKNIDEHELGIILSKWFVNYCEDEISDAIEKAKKGYIE